MNNRKLQAQMQIDVSFIGKTEQLVKNLNATFKSLDLSSQIVKPLGTDLSKTFKDIYTNLDKMAEGLSKKGLSPKQYDAFFTTINAKIADSAQMFGNLQKGMEDAFNSAENKKALKDLEQYKKQLAEINKLVTNQKKLNTRQQTAKNQIKEITGFDFEDIKPELDKIKKRRASGKKDLTPGQSNWWFGDIGGTKEELEEILKIMERIDALQDKKSNINKESQDKYGADALKAQAATEKKIKETSGIVFTEDALKRNIAILKQEEETIKDVYGISDTLMKHWHTELPRATDEAKQMVEAQQTIKEIFAQFGIIFSASTIVQAFKDIASAAFEFYKSLDSALNEIYVVSNLSIESVNKLQSSFVNMAKTTGMSIDDITRSATLFYQQGLNTDEVMEMTRVTSEFAKVAGIDATDAADKLTAAVNGYCLAAEDASIVADKFNKVAAASAADINELSTAFSKAAAQANQAGVGMDNYLAYIATMVEATREAPENIGTSLKTIMSRMQQVKDAGTTEDGETDVNQVETALKSVGVALRDANGELRDLEDVFADLGPKWNTLDRNTQAYLGTIIAGTRQQSRFITLMQNWDRVLDLSEQSANSAGMQSLMHAKAMESVESKLQQLGVAWQEFVSNLTDSSTIKMFIELFTKLADAVNDGTKPLMLIGSAIALLSPKIKKLEKPLVNIFKQVKNNLGAAKAAITGTFDKKSNAYFTSDAEKSYAISAAKAKVAAAQENQMKAQTKFDMVNNLSLEKKTQEEIAIIEKKRIEYAQELERAKKEETDATQELLETEKKQVLTKEEAQQKTLNTIAVGVNLLGMALSNVDEAAGAAVSGLGNVGVGIAKIATGTDIIGGVTSLVMGAIQLWETFKDWDEKMANKLTEAADSVNQALTDLSNTNTQVRSTEELLDRYDTLQNKIHRTAAEQEELNNIAQQMSDSFDSVTAVTDAYGNLSINVRNARGELALLKEQYNEQYDELKKTEVDSVLDATGGLFNTNTMKDAYAKIWSTNKGTYRSMLSGVEDGLSDELRNISAGAASEFSENLKDSITHEVESNSLLYGHKGLLDSMLEIEEGITGDLGSSDWNELYDQMNILEQNLENMTFNEVQDSLDSFYNSWSGKNKTTQEEWELLKKTMNSTLYDNSPLLDFYNSTEDTMSKLTDDDSKDIIKAMDNLRKEEQEFLLVQAGMAAGGAAIGAGVGALAGGIPTAGIGAGPGAAIGAAIGTVAGGIGAYFTKDAKEYRAAQKELSEIINENKDLLKEIMDSNKNLKTEEQALNWVYTQNQVKETLQDSTQETQKYLSSLGSLYDLTGLDDKEAMAFATNLSEAMGQIELGDTDAEKYNYLAKWFEENKGSMTEDVRKHWQEVVDEAFDNLQITSRMSFTQLGNELKSISSDLQTMNKLVDEFNKNGGGMSLDNFMELSKVFDDISNNLGSLGAMKDGGKYIDEYIDAIDKLNLAYDANTGYITMNGDSLQTLQKIQEIQTKSKIASMVADLKASRATTETELAYIDAQIAATDAAIAALEAEAGTKVTQTELMGKADAEYMRVFDARVADIQSGYKNDVEGQGKWAKAILSNLGKVSNAWNKYYTGIRSGSDISLDEIYKSADEILDGSEYKWEGSAGTSGIDWKNYNSTLVTGSDEAEKLKAQLQEYRNKLVNTRSEYQAVLESTQGQINLLEGMLGADLSKLGLEGKADEIEKYVGKLKEIYNILNRIQLLEHRLSTLDSYADMAQGEQYGDLLQERLKYNQELVGQYEFLVKEQKKFTNGYKDFIGTVEGLEGVFDFDEFGQIIINWDKYNALQDEAADGSVTLKEKADDVYDTYTAMFEELHGYFDSLIDYYKAVIELQQEMVDSYKDLQKQAADAVKEIYQDMLDTQLEAIDKEMEALEELREARENARTDRDNAEALSDLQTNIQRTMMDSSGASDISFIKAQKDMRDKLEEIAEDKYSKMLDDIIDKLEQEKDALQKNFDDLFSNLEWLFSWLDKDIMGNESELFKLLQGTSSWEQASFLERKEMQDDWKTKFETYADTIKTDEKGIYAVYDNISTTREAIGKLDSTLKSSISEGSAEIAQTLGKWGADVKSSIGSLSSQISSLGNQLNNQPKKEDPPKTPTPYNDNYNPAQVTTPTWKVNLVGYQYVHTQEGKVGNSCNLPTPPAKPGHLFRGWAIDGDNKNLKTGSFKPERGEHLASAIYDPITINAKSNSTTTTTPPPLNPFPLVTGPTLTLTPHAKGGMLRHTGPIWVDGTASNPEAVLTALQTKHFVNFAENLDKMYAGQGDVALTGGTVNIGNISFSVESMSSPEDGEVAFDMFVNKFKEIGNQTGIKIDSFTNRL